MTAPAKIAITGATGLVGRRLAQSLTEAGRTALRMVRRADPGARDTIPWSPDALDPQALAGVNAVVHLAGEPVAQRWSQAVKDRIRGSRVQGTATIARAVAAMDPKPEVLVCASAIGFYGFRGEEELTEDSAAGAGFLPEVCQQWEAATTPAGNAGIRVVHVRIGLVVAANGGALKKMLPPFRLGLGGKLGDGKQWMSWIALDDLVSILRRALDDDTMSGAYNAVAPTPVRNTEFTKALGSVLGRWTPFPIPRFALRLLFGEMADVMLGSQRVRPARLVAEGFTFGYPELKGALAHVLGKGERAD